MDAKAPPKSVVDEVYKSLKRSIVENLYQPGQRLRALRVAQELKVSRTPVKEALVRLEQEGLIRREQGSGFIVRGLSVREILNLYRVREVLEVEAAREAFPNLTPAALSAMRGALDEADALLAQERYPDFLRASNLSGRFWSIGTVVVSRHAQRADEIRDENRAILDALAAGDLKAVEKAVKAHVKGAANAVHLFIENETQHLFIVAA